MIFFAVTSVFLAVLVVSSAVVVAMLDWAGHLPLSERIALNAIAAGLLWAAPSWLSGHRPPGFGEVLFLAGLTLLMAARYGRAVSLHFAAAERDRDDPIVTWGPGR